MQLDVANLGESISAALASAAFDGDERRFVAAFARLELPLPTADDYVRMARLAFQAGAVRLAHRLIVDGAGRHPEDSWLSRGAEVIAPARARLVEAPPTSDAKSDRAWLDRHAREFSGRWVALRDGRLLGAGPTLAELRASLPDARGAYFTKIPA